MVTIFGIPSGALFGQLLIGLINGSFYALLSLGLAVIFGMLNIINFTHGAQYMLGALTAFLLLNFTGLGYWPALVIAPIVVGITGMLVERFFLQWIYKLDHLYGLLLTFGLALIVEDLVRIGWGDAPYPVAAPPSLAGIVMLGDVPFSKYRLFVIAVTAVLMFLTWLCLEKTLLGRTILAGTFDREMVRILGIRINLLFTLVFGLGAALAGLAGALAAPIRGVFPTMGTSIIMPSFVVVIIGGMGSFGGALIGGISVGVIIGLTVELFAPASDVIVFVLLAAVLLVRPRGLFGIEGLLSR